MMSCFLIAVAFVGLAQTESAPDPDQKTYIITLQDGRKVPVIWDTEQEGKDWIHVQIDEPWQPQPMYWSGKVSEIQKRLEIPSVREQRIREGWLAQGFVEVNGRHVSASEKAWADRARELAGVAMTGSIDPVQSPSANASPAIEAPNPAAASAGSGLAWQWGAYAGLVVVAVLLVVIVARTMVFT